MLAVGAWPLATGLTVALTPTEAFAQSRSSGGYSRPSASRTPSFSTSRPSVRTPSTSGGYARPSSPPSSRPSFSAPSSAGDRAVSRQRSADALGSFRTQQAPRPQAAPAPSSAPSSVWGGGGTSRPAPPPPVIRPAERPGWYSQRGWTNPGSWYGPPRSFGVWDGLFLWALVSNLSRPASADFFHNHRNDPGYQEWRAEADRMAKDNADLRQKLAELDRKLAERQGSPVDPNYLPPDVPPEVALAMPVAARTPSVAANDNDGGTPWVLIALIVGGAVVGWAIWQRMRQRGKGDDSMKILGSAGAMLRHKLSGDTYKPDRLRVGMTFPFDPTPFILASGATKVAAPAPDTGSARLTVTAVGTAVGGGSELIRLYLPDNRSVFQLHMDPSGNPDECRFFSRIDEITPADQQEWAAWLHPAEGMIGWPQFQTKDGRMYDRVWAPGPTRIPPLAMTETIETAEGGTPKILQRQAMLYAAPTGAPAPAPETEYILVSVVESDGQAWVEVAAGMDVSPGMLELS